MLNVRAPRDVWHEILFTGYKTINHNIKSFTMTSDSYTVLHATGQGGPCRLRGRLLGSQPLTPVATAGGSLLTLCLGLHLTHHTLSPWQPGEVENRNIEHVPYPPVYICI